MRSLYDKLVETERTHHDIRQISCQNVQLLEKGWLRGRIFLFFLFIGFAKVA